MVNAELALRIILLGVVCNIPCALLGNYLVLRRLSLLGDAISHAVLPGIAIGYLLTHQLDSWVLLAGAMAFGVLAALLTQTLHRYGGVPEDASLGAVFTALFAVGVLLINTVKADLDPGCVLYGQPELTAVDTVTFLGIEVPRALWTLLPVLVLTVAFILVMWKELKVGSFDPQLATAMGLNAGLVHYLLMGMVAAVTVAAFQVVGSVLVIAMLIVPAAAAHLLTDRLAWMMVVAALVAVLATVGGCAAAVWLNTSTAGMMAVAAGLLFGAAALVGPRHGVISQLVRQLKLSMQIAGEDVLAQLYRREEKATGDVHDRDCRKTAGGGMIGWLALAALRRRKLVNQRPDHVVCLTDAGRERARSVVRSHRLWETYLVQHFDLPLDHLHEPAERVEHFITPALEQKLSAELAHPKSDPHGRPIPGDGPQ